jgi:predicted ABC-type transport system involved in lysophospholipase L1 biosynthesis ATPase subunit
LPDPGQLLTCVNVDLLLVDPATVVAILGLGGAGVSALWKIAAGLGKFEAKTTTILGAMQIMLQDHEERIRVIERKY